MQNWNANSKQVSHFFISLHIQRWFNSILHGHEGSSIFVKYQFIKYQFMKYQFIKYQYIKHHYIKYQFIKHQIFNFFQRKMWAFWRESMQTSSWSGMHRNWERTLCQSGWNCNRRGLWWWKNWKYLWRPNWRG